MLLPLGVVLTTTTMFLNPVLGAVTVVGIVVPTLTPSIRTSVIVAHAGMVVVKVLVPPGVRISHVLGTLLVTVPVLPPVLFNVEVNPITGESQSDEP